MVPVPRILVTGFVPFGPVRGHVPGLRGNRSQDLLELLRRRRGGEDWLAFLTMPVSDESSAILQRHLHQHRTAGVLLMGEGLLDSMKLELRARDPSQQLGPLRLPWAGGRESAFAVSIAADMRRRGVSESTSAGTYHCNRLYWHALGEGGCDGAPPVAFVHVGLRATLDWQYSHLEFLLGRMRERAGMGW